MRHEPSSRPSSTPPRRAPRRRAAFSLLCLLLMIAPALRLAVAAADDRGPAPAATPTPAGTPDEPPKKKGRGGGEATPPASTAAPRPRPAPVSTAAPAPAAAGTPSVAPSGTVGPLSFTDDDLRKYHAGKPPDESETEATTVTQSGAAADAPPLLQSKAVAGKRPPAKPAATEADPLKKYRDQEQTEKMRGEQLQKLREQIAQAQARLETLKQKRAAILDPYRIMPKPESADEAQEEAKLKPNELLERVDEEIAQAGSDLEELQQSLVKIESRFQGGQGP